MEKEKVIDCVIQFFFHIGRHASGEANRLFRMTIVRVKIE